MTVMSCMMYALQESTHTSHVPYNMRLYEEEEASDPPALLTVVPCFLAR